ncbi:hypothetical protein GCM10009416_34210 [Craurococcus roseus]|uniref:Uncharacterized protein n=1 Tax=Craurococcus roseus TaxID=77585 RepID=A0ABN1FKY0_9PROT
MPRLKSAEVADQITDGGFVTVDAFRRSAETLCRRISDEGWKIALGTSSDRPVYLVEGFDDATLDDRADAVEVDLEDVRVSATWNAMSVHIKANDTCYVLKGSDDQPMGLIRIHPDFDRSRILRFARQHTQRERDQRLSRIQQDVTAIREALVARGIIAPE